MIRIIVAGYLVMLKGGPSVLRNPNTIALRNCVMSRLSSLIIIVIISWNFIRKSMVVEFGG